MMPVAFRVATPLSNLPHAIVIIVPIRSPVLNDECTGRETPYRDQLQGGAAHISTTFLFRRPLIPCENDSSRIAERRHQLRDPDRHREGRAESAHPARPRAAPLPRRPHGACSLPHIFSEDFR